ncbi:HAMP domain-containing sensor histidine kinase [Hymenobacter sp. H14-R3]|uniref:sensor histidine kinase n=1 Tax=Hymenobacter sp. H14-R3 TaxID=3046308 RepID=UPI0024B878B2|nr:HAMP domain-containing sensor histidine kinase [Hymenobacter sp. H14-R3]MDJ0366572.1 HAMP domain-containing sensor histidine kinase [Hymenobacter sp. H14-R3]
MNLRFKDRIALHYMLATAALVAAAYLVVFGVVHHRVYTDLDRNLRFEATKHMGELAVTATTIRFANRSEWEEREHLEVQVAPVFIQVNDARGHLTDRSPNLKADQLAFDATPGWRAPRNSVLRGKALRQLQVPVVRGGATVGYLLAAISSEAAQQVLSSLEMVLLGSFPVVLLVLFGSARGLAGRSIAPIIQLTAATNRITRTNLAERVALPPRPDELHTLASAINGLLHRVEQAVEREKQFTADASHELRTPLAVLRGTLEVLVRKPRTVPEYVENISLGIQEIDRLTYLVDQLLLLARFENHAKTLNHRELAVGSCVHDVLHRHRNSLNTKHIRVDVQDPDPTPITSDPYLVDLILDNVLANAIKYSLAGSAITVVLAPAGPGLSCTIRDEGIGIRPEELDKIFDPLYRSDALSHKHIGGTGLGLSIVAKASALLGIKLEVQSVLGQGTAFTLRFPA